MQAWLVPVCVDTEETHCPPFTGSALKKPSGIYDCVGSHLQREREGGATVTEPSAVCPMSPPAQKDRPHWGHLSPQRLAVSWTFLHCVPIGNKPTRQQTSLCPSIMTAQLDASVGTFSIFWNIFEALLYRADSSRFGIREQRNAANPLARRTARFHITFRCQNGRSLFQTGMSNREVLSEGLVLR